MWFSSWCKRSRLNSSLIGFVVVGFGSYYHLIISLTTNTSLNFYKKAWSTLNIIHFSDPGWVSNLDALTRQFKSKSRVQVNFTICNKRSGNIMCKYPPTVEEINQTTTLNQPFQIEFTVLPAKSDSESD